MTSANDILEKRGRGCVCVCTTTPKEEEGWVGGMNVESEGLREPDGGGRGVIAGWKRLTHQI